MKSRNKYLKSKRKLVSTLYSFLGVAVVLTVINLFFSPGYFWAKFPIVGMSLGLIIQTFTTLGKRAAYKMDIKEAKREEEILDLQELREEEILREESRGWKSDDLV